MSHGSNGFVEQDVNGCSMEWVCFFGSVSGVRDRSPNNGFASECSGRGIGRDLLQVVEERIVAGTFVRGWIRKCWGKSVSCC